MLRIGAVYEKDGKTPKKSHAKLIGRCGTIFNNSSDIEQSLIFEYSNKKLLGTYLRTSRMERIDETDCGVWIYTRNTVYRFDNIQSSEINHNITCFSTDMFAKFLGENGYDSQLKEAFEDGLIVGEMYEVDNVIIDD